MMPWVAYIAGMGVIAAGIYWIITRRVGIGIEGRPPAFFVRGNAAVLLGVIAVLIGTYILWNPDILP